MSQPPLAVTVSRTVMASPESLYDLVADVTRVGEHSPETVSARWLDDRGPVVGARFRGHNRIGFLRWSTVATVSAAEPGRRFAFDTAAPSRTAWTYTFEPVEDGTRVTESMCRQDAQPATRWWMQRLAGVPDREDHLHAGMTATLARLDSAATAAVAS